MLNKKKYLLSLFLLSLSFILVAKPKPSLLDSLLSVFNPADTSKQNISRLGRSLGIASRSNQLELHDSLAHMYVTFATRHNMTYRQLGGLNELGVVQRKKGDYEKALQFYQEALLVADEKGVEDYKYIIYYNIGATYQDMGDDLNSIANFEKSNEVALKFKREMPYSYSCSGIGTLLAKRKQYGEALHYYEEALKYSKNSKDEFKIGIDHANLAICHVFLGNLKDAALELETARTISEKIKNDDLSVNVDLGDSRLAMAKGEKAKALEAAKRGYDRIKGKHSLESIDIMVQLARCYNENGKKNQALFHFNELSTLAKKIDYRVADEAIFDLGIAIYAQSGQSQKALELANNRNEYKDQLFDFDYQYQLANHEKAQEILGKSLENKRLVEVNTLVSKQNSTLYKIGGLLLLLIGFLAFSLFKIRDLFKKEKVNSEKLSAKEQVLKAQNTKLVDLNKQLKTFNFSLAHDIRSGLNAILEHTDKEKDQNNFPSAVAVNAKASYLKNFCENLLTYYSVSNKSAALEEVDMNEVVAAQLKLLDDKILRANAVVNIEDLPVIYAHNVSIHQLFHNLLENALAYALPDRRPEVNISCQQIENYFHLTVADNGRGIPQEEQDSIFKIFTKGNDGNTGIGLAICKNVVDYYSGNIWVESTPGQGTMFHFTLPTD